MLVTGRQLLEYICSNRARHDVLRELRWRLFTRVEGDEFPVLRKGIIVLLHGRDNTPYEVSKELRDKILGLRDQSATTPHVDEPIAEAIPLPVASEEALAQVNEPEQLEGGTVPSREESIQSESEVSASTQVAEETEEGDPESVSEQDVDTEPIVEPAQDCVSSEPEPEAQKIFVLTEEEMEAEKAKTIAEWEAKKAPSVPVEPKPAVVETAAAHYNEIAKAKAAATVVKEEKKVAEDTATQATKETKEVVKSTSNSGNGRGRLWDILGILGAVLAVCVLAFVVLSVLNPGGWLRITSGPAETAALQKSGSPSGPSLPSAPSAGTSSSAFSGVAGTVSQVTPESVMLSPQGELLADGRFTARDIVAPQGWPGIIFDGQLTKGGPSVMLVFGPWVHDLTYVQGTWYAISTDPLAVAIRIGGEKSSRNPGLLVQVFGVDGKLVKEYRSSGLTAPAIGQAAQPLAGTIQSQIQPTAVAQGGYIPAPQLPVQPAQPAQSAVQTATNWSSVIGISGDRLEACPGEEVNRCVHIKDGQPISVTIPSGYKYEGWDGTKTVHGNGPVSLTVAGLTIRTAS